MVESKIALPKPEKVASRVLVTSGVPFSFSSERIRAAFAEMPQDTACLFPLLIDNRPASLVFKKVDPFFHHMQDRFFTPTGAIETRYIFEGMQTRADPRTLPLSIELHVPYISEAESRNISTRLILADRIIQGELSIIHTDRKNYSQNGHNPELYKRAEWVYQEDHDHVPKIALFPQEAEAASLIHYQISLPA